MNGTPDWLVDIDDLWDNKGNAASKADGGDILCSAARTYSVRTRVVLVLALALAILASVGLPSLARAQSWPAAWILIDTDANEPGQANYRDVLSAYYNYDSNHLYLRLNTVSTPVFSGLNGPARFKWFIDVGLGSNLYHACSSSIFRYR